jgi:hypothetical protein
MSWAKLCGTFAFHRKILEVGNEGAGAWARMLSYAAENLTGGKVSRAAASSIAPDAVVAALVAASLLDHDGDSYVVHDFGDFNPTGAELAARKAELRAKRAEAGRRGAFARWQNGKRDGKADGKPHGKNMRTSPSPSPSSVPVTGEIPASPVLSLTGELPFGDSLRGETREAPRRATREAKHTPEEIATKNRIVEAFAEAFETAKGVAPSLDHPADHEAAFKLAARYGPDEGSAIVRRALTDTWVVDRNPTLRHIASKPDAWRGLTPANPKRPLLQERSGQQWADVALA